MEFFRCPCPKRGSVILNGSDLGSNMDATGKLLTKVCGQGLQRISLQFPDGKQCIPPQIEIEIKNTDPISPMEVPFQCEM